MSAQPKYRPSLTLSQLQSIVDHLPIDAPEHRSILRIIKGMIYKASEGIVQPAFVTVPKASLDQSLGFETSTSTNDPGESLWKLYCDGTTLSEKQILDAMGYAFTHDLLTPEQESQYTQMLLDSQSDSSSPSSPSI